MWCGGRGVVGHGVMVGCCGVVWGCGCGHCRVCMVVLVCWCEGVLVWYLVFGGIVVCVIWGVGVGCGCGMVVWGFEGVVVWR